MSHDHDDDYVELYYRGSNRFVRRGSNINDSRRQRGASSDPKKCSHPDDRGRNCSYCGVYVRGDDMG